MLAATGIHMDDPDPRDLYCGFSTKVGNKEHLQCLQNSWVPSQNALKQKKWHIKCHL